MTIIESKFAVYLFVFLFFPTITSQWDKTIPTKFNTLSDCLSTDKTRNGSKISYITKLTISNTIIQYSADLVMCAPTVYKHVELAFFASSFLLFVICYYYFNFLFHSIFVIFYSSLFSFKFTSFISSPWGNCWRIAYFWRSFSICRINKWTWFMDLLLKCNTLVSNASSMNVTALESEQWYSGLDSGGLE